MYQKPWDTERDRLKLVILDQFLLFYSPKNLKNQNYEKMKKNCWSYTYVSEITIIWSILPETGSATDSIFCHFRPFFALLDPWKNGKSEFCKNEKNLWRYYHYTNVLHKWQSYNIWSWDMECDKTQFVVILGHFLMFYPHDNLENHHFEKMKKIPRDIIILHMCTINDNHIKYGSWDMEHIESLGATFCPLIPLIQPRKSKFWKNEENVWRYYQDITNPKNPEISILTM